MIAGRARILAAAIAACLCLGPARLVFPATSSGTVNLANPTSQTTDTLALGYSPNATSLAAGIVTVNNGTRTADNSAFCVTFTLSNPGQQGGMVFSLVNASTGAALSLTGSPSNSSQVISGSFAAGTAFNTNKVYNIAFSVDPSAMPAPGTYTATIVERLYRGSTFPPSGSPVDTNTLTVTITVGSFYDVSVVPAGSAFSLGSTSQAMNFGTLAPGLMLGVDIVVRTNVTYSLSIASAGKGAMTNAADPTSSIAYSLSSNGSSLALNPGPGHAASGAAATFMSAARYSILATILPFASYPSAGNYSDTLTITVSSP